LAGGVQGVQGFLASMQPLNGGEESSSGGGLGGFARDVTPDIIICVDYNLVHVDYNNIVHVD